jgi:hypothetical protein
MTTERQNEARRQNGAKSRGPKTPEGKAVSRLNAMRFGIYSELTIVDGENEEVFVQFGRRLRTDLALVGEMELTLADKIVSTAWRLRRIVQVEAALYDDNQTIERIFRGYNGDAMNRIGRHAAQLKRAFYRAMHELERLQDKRCGQYVPPPEAIDITVSTADDLDRDEASLGLFRQNNEKHPKALNNAAEQ